MSWSSEPSTEEIIKWFNGIPLHEGMDQYKSKYIGGIVVIKNAQTKQYNPYPLAGTRIAYFWDWVTHNDYRAVIETRDPVEFDMPFRAGEEAGTFLTAKSLYVAATVRVMDHEGNVLRESTARKQVALNMKVNNWVNGKAAGKITIPDFTSCMKAETGAIARAVAQLGMLSLPGSGIASAEDMQEFISNSEDENVVSKSSEPQGRKASSPKQSVVS